MNDSIVHAFFSFSLDFAMVRNVGIMSIIPYRTKSTNLRFILLGLLAYLFFTVVRSWYLLSNGRGIAEHSQTFKRDYYIGNKSDAPFTYLVMGDSTAAGWGAADLAGSYPYQIAKFVAGRGYYVYVVNVAVGGARLQNLNREQLPALKRIKPDLITISIGANDATHFTSDNDYSRDLQILLSALKNSGARKIFIANTPDMYQAPALTLPLAITTNNRARRLNAILDESLKGTNIQRIELYNEGKLIYRENPNLYATDLFHPSSKGYSVWARLFIRELEGL